MALASDKKTGLSPSWFSFSKVPDLNRGLVMLARSELPSPPNPTKPQVPLDLPPHRCFSDMLTRWRNLYSSFIILLVSEESSHYMCSFSFRSKTHFVCSFKYSWSRIFSGSPRRINTLISITCLSNRIVLLSRSGEESVHICSSFYELPLMSDRNHVKLDNLIPFDFSSSERWEIYQNYLLLGSGDIIFPFLFFERENLSIKSALHERRTSSDFIFEEDLHYYNRFAFLR